MSLSIDIKYATRLLQKKPLFTLTSILMVAVGLALTVYTFTLLNQLIFKPLKLSTDAPVIALEGEFHSGHGRGQEVDPYHLNQISQESRLLHSLSMYETGFSTMAGYAELTRARKIHIGFVQWNLFDVVGVQPVMGRGLQAADQDPGAEPVIVIGYDVWRQHFAGKQDIIGTQINVSGEPKTIVGVMPKGFAFPAIAQMWQPLPSERLAPSQPSNRNTVLAVARLQENATLHDFQQEVALILDRQFVGLPQDMQWRANSPGGYIRAFAFKLTDDNVYHHYSVFVALLAVVLLILLLTCINVGNLLLVRVNERMKEVAIRISLGVPRKRLIFQMLFESIVICVVGGFIALGMAHWGVKATNELLEQLFIANQERPFWWHLHVGTEALIVLTITTVFMILLTGCIPAWRALSSDVNTVLRDGTRGALGRHAGKANKALVTIEIALSCVVLTTATMLLTSSYSAHKADYGVETENRLAAEILLPFDTYIRTPSRKKRNDFYYRLKDDLESLPNVEKVAYFSSLPGTGGGSSHYEIQGRAAPVFNENPQWNFEIVSREAWDAVGIRLLEGRDFNVRDLGQDDISVRELESPVIINESMARDHFPNGDAVGQKVRTVTENRQFEWRTIIGVVSDTVHGSVAQTTSANHTGYGLMDLRGWMMKIVIHYSGPLENIEAALKDAINKIEPEATAANVQTYDDLIKQPMVLVDAVNRLFLWSGFIALFLAASGIYAVYANSLTLRSQEIATRRAIGATDKRVIRMFLKESGMQLLVGLSIGLVITLWIVQQITNAMIILPGSYLLGFAGIPVFIAVMVCLATYIPSKKATQTEPVHGLRQA